MSDEPIRMLAYHVPVSQEMLDDALDFREALAASARMTPEERELARAQHEARKARELAAAHARHAVVRAQLDGKLREVLDLHRPQRTDHAVDIECLGCEFGGYESEPPQWPCTTWAVIADGLEQRTTG